MKPEQTIRLPWIKWGLMFAVWTLIGLSFAQQFYFSRFSIGYAVTWSHALSHSLSDWYLFAVLSIPVTVLSRRFTLGRANWGNHSIIHLVAGALFSVAWVALRCVLAKWQITDGTEALSFAEAFKSLLAKTFHFNFFVYWAVVSVAHAFDYYRKFVERERNSLELEKRLTQARLEALQCQLNPHFLFNTLHAISALMHKDVDAADRMIVRLSELLRYALESTDAHEVPLKQELAFLERYLEIEQTRFGKRLEVNRQIDPAALNAKVPNLVLQPLVENAIQHGIERQAKAGRIEIHAHRENGHLRLQVRDNGPGAAGQKPVEGIGLSNTRARLQQLYGAAQQMEFQSPTEGGFIVDLTIPFRATAENEPEVTIGQRKLRK